MPALFTTVYAEARRVESPFIAEDTEKYRHMLEIAELVSGGNWFTGTSTLIPCQPANC